MPARHAKPTNMRLAPVLLLTAGGTGLGGLALTTAATASTASGAAGSPVAGAAASFVRSTPVTSEVLHAPMTTTTASAASSQRTTRGAASRSRVVAGRVPPVASAPALWVAPVNAVITSPFGFRWGRLHKGLDFGASYGTAIHAAADGVVIAAGQPESGYGNMVLIRHAGGVVTAYAHQSRIVATVGEVVHAGEIIGYVGSTGHSTGPHLHFEVRIGGTKAIDPRPWLKAHGVIV